MDGSYAGPLSRYAFESFFLAARFAERMTNTLQVPVKIERHPPVNNVEQYLPIPIDYFSRVYEGVWGKRTRYQKMAFEFVKDLYLKGLFPDIPKIAEKQGHSNTWDLDFHKDYLKHLQYQIDVENGDAEPPEDLKKAMKKQANGEKQMNYFPIQTCSNLLFPIHLAIL